MNNKEIIVPADTQNKKALVVFSGGLDSTILLHWAKQNFKEVEAISFDFKQNFQVNYDANKIMFQNNVVELLYARDTARKLNIKANQRALQKIVKNLLGREVCIYALNREDSTTLLTKYRNLDEVNKLPKKTEVEDKKLF